jgi:hypothetical protein
VEALVGQAVEETLVEELHQETVKALGDVNLEDY